MDIEGHEDLCLQGGLEILNKYRPTILMEVNKAFFTERKLDLDETFLPLFPENYLIFRNNKKNWELITSLTSCNDFDNIFLVPQEKLTFTPYRVFEINVNSEKLESSNSLHRK